MRRWVAGFALISALVISTILFIIGIAFVQYVSNDYGFAGQEQASTAAYFLARSGMSYYATNGLPPADVSGMYSVDIPVNDPQHVCIFLYGNDMTFVGQVRDGMGRTVAERRLVAPGGVLTKWYEATR